MGMDDDYDTAVAPSLDQRVFSCAGEGQFDRAYEQGHELGLGAFAEVFLGTHKKTGAEYAIKKIDRSKMIWANRDALEDEINNLALVRDGPNIVQLYEVYEERTHCYLVMELMRGGELFDRILDKKTFTEKEAREGCRCILQGVKYMHKSRVAHRDLKPENLLLADEKGTYVKLADFGFARRVKKVNGCRTLCGTPGYLAPEILERFPAYDTKCDLWSVGVILFLLLGGYLPFEDEDEDKVFERTRNGEYDFHPAYWKDVNTNAKDLVTKLLTVNPNKRYAADQALEHPWMTSTMSDDDAGAGSRGVNMDKLKENVIKGKKKAAAEVAAAATGAAAGRIDQLGADFAGYLDRKGDDGKSKIKTDASSGAPPKAPVRKFVEDSATGKPFFDFYEFGEVLGEGGYACVYRATHLRTKDIYAIKDINTAVLEASSKSALKDEIAALKLLRGGPHIIRLFDVFEEEDHTYLVMEEMRGGDLLTRITEKEVYTEREARKTCKIIFQAMDYIHKKKIAHRDIKPENVLMVEADDDHSIKIADFGFAKRVPKANCLRTLCGTAQYVAPEVLDLQSFGYDHRADMWSVGVVTYILLGGYAPFEGPVQELARAICKADYCFHDKYWKDISDNAKNMISRLLEIEAETRLTAEEALQCPWMTAEEETLAAKDLGGAQEKIAEKKQKAEQELAAQQQQQQQEEDAENAGGGGAGGGAGAGGAGGAGGTAKKSAAAGHNLPTSATIDKFNSLDIDFTAGLGTLEEVMNRKRGEKATGGHGHHGHGGAGGADGHGGHMAAVSEDGTSNAGDGSTDQDDEEEESFESLYKLGALLVEEGNFAHVYEAKDQESGEEFSVKRISRAMLDAADAVAVQDEISALQQVADCPYICKLHDVFEEPDYTYMVMDRLQGGELIDRLIERRHYNERDARRVIKRVLLGVEYCHNRRIAIRNIKTENLLLTHRNSDVHVKLSDFGFAKRVLYPNSLQTQCGTEGYVAPEILEHRPAYDVQCDMWSVGVVLYIILGGYRPFRGEGEEVVRQTRYGEYKFHKRYWKNISDEAKNLIIRMLTLTPIARITSTAALQSDWLLMEDDDEDDGGYDYNNSNDVAVRD